MKLGIALILLLVGVLIGLFVIPNLGKDWSPALGRFLTSPGAAVVAAVIAATALAYQLAHTKAKDRDEAWWANFRWATDRAVPQKSDERQLSLTLSVTILNSLQKSAVSELQKKACGGFLDHLTKTDGDAKAPELEEESILGVQDDAQLEDALSSYIAGTENTPAQSLGANVLLYDRQTRNAFREAYKSLAAGPASVPLLIKYGTEHNRDLLLKQIRQEIDARRDRYARRPFLIITPLELTSAEQEVLRQEQLPMTIVKWAPGDGVRHISEAISKIHNDVTGPQEPAAAPPTSDSSSIK